MMILPCNTKMEIASGGGVQENSAPASTPVAPSAGPRSSGRAGTARSTDVTEVGTLFQATPSPSAAVEPGARTQREICIRAPDRSGTLTVVGRVGEVSSADVIETPHASAGQGRKPARNSKTS